MTETAARPDIGRLKEWARVLRRDIIEMTTKAGSGHPSSSFSAAEIVSALYFGGILDHKPSDPHWEDRDRFVLSKGHACPVLYAALGEAGYFPTEWFDHLRELDSPLEGHPNVKRCPGIEASTGSLGQGLSISVGMAFATHLDGRKSKVYCMTGDGELGEGQVWEAAASAGKYYLPNLVWIIDQNGYQQTGSTHDIMPMTPLADKVRTFGWHVREINGQDLNEVVDALTEAKAYQEGPFCLIANTHKGAGVSFVEADWHYHGKALTKPEAVRALTELGWPEEAKKFA